MKTQKIISIKRLRTIVLLLSITSLVACQSQENKSVKEELELSVSKTTVKTPSVDIHTATFLGNLQVIKQHISYGTDINMKDQYGSTPLIIAITFDKTEIAKALIQAGADLHIRNNEGSTPLHIAAFFCRTDIVKSLLENGADKNLKNSYGSTVLESVSTPFNDVKVIYDQLSKGLGPLGLKFDYEYLEKTRPIIAKLLQE